MISFAFAAAEFSAQAGYDWLSAQATEEGAFNNDVSATAWSIMALDGAGYDTDSYEDWLYAKMSEEYCLPSTGCSTKDTSMAIVALNELQDDAYFDLMDEWFASALQGGSFTGDWMIEIGTDASGTCSFEYELNNVTQEKEIEVLEGKFPACSDSSFLNLDECIQTNLIKNNPGMTLGIDCGDLEDDVVMTLLYRSANTYYLLDNQDSKVNEFIVNNGCFATTSTGSCNKEASLYAGWALDLVDSETNVLIYLKENYDETNSLDNSILYFITKDTNYLEALEDLQKVDGSFDRDVFRTAISILALEDYSSEYSDIIEDAKSWLREQQGADGDWNNKIEDSAIALFAAFSEGVSAATCSDGIQNQGEEGIDCGGPCDSCFGDDEDECFSDDDCSTGYECFGGTCTYVGSSGCVADEDCDTFFGELCIEGVCMVSECDFDGVCDYPNSDENSNNCPDCECGDGILDDYEEVYGCSLDEVDEPVDEDECESDDDCDFDEECNLYGECVPKIVEKKGGFGWIIFIIIILILGGVGFFLYKKGYLDAILMKFKGKPKQPSYRPPYTPSKPPGFQRPGGPPRQQSNLQRGIQQARQQFKK